MGNDIVRMADLRLKQADVGLVLPNLFEVLTKAPNEVECSESLDDEDFEVGNESIILRYSRYSFDDIPNFVELLFRKTPITINIMGHYFVKKEDLLLESLVIELLSELPSKDGEYRREIGCKRNVPSSERLLRFIPGSFYSYPYGKEEWFEKADKLLELAVRKYNLEQYISNFLEKLNV